MVAAFVGLLTIALAVWVWKKESRGPVRKLGWIALGVVVAQGILGGVTVLWYLPAPISVLHACLAQTFFCLVVSLAWLSSPTWTRQRGNASYSLPLNRLAMATAGAVYLQLLLGAIFRHTQTGVLPHLLGALLVTVLAFLLIARVFQSQRLPSGLTAAATSLGILLGLQLLLGLASWLLRLATADAVQPQFPVVVVTTAHVAVGALILATSVILALQSFRSRSEERRAEFSVAATPVNP
jgi:cytochrome c oxidase assembly protein subunit 15